MRLPIRQLVLCEAVTDIPRRQLSVVHPRPHQQYEHGARAGLGSPPPTRRAAVAAAVMAMSPTRSGWWWCWRLRGYWTDWRRRRRWGVRAGVATDKEGERVGVGV